MPTIPGSLRSTARRVPGDPALVFGDRVYAYAGLDAAVDRTASALAGLGLRRGDRFALMAANSDRFVVTFYSIEVESALAAHPDVADVAVVGRPHPDYGESIVAV